MSSIYFDPALTDEGRREAIYDGSLIVYSPRPASLAFCRHAAQMIEEAFEGKDPTTIQHSIPVEEFAAIATPLKSSFIHHAKSKRLIADLLIEMGCDPDDTYFDVPRLRMATSDGYWTSGAAYAHHAHRDTWYSAPMCQINWWLPIYPIGPENAMAFHPRYFREAVPNDSDRFNYYEWNGNQRRNAAQHVKKRHPLAAPCGYCARAGAGRPSHSPLWAASSRSARRSFTQRFLILPASRAGR